MRRLCCRVVFVCVQTISPVCGCTYALNCTLHLRRSRGSLMKRDSLPACRASMSTWNGTARLAGTGGKHNTPKHDNMRIAMQTQREPAANLGERDVR